MLQEVLPAMKVVKYYAWEPFFEAKVMECRRAEERLTFWNNVLKTFNICLVFTVPPLGAWTIFTAYEFKVDALGALVRLACTC